MPPESSTAPGLSIAVHGHPNADTTLLWHPDASRDPDSVARLATQIASDGRRVVVPMWEGGRDLLRSVRYARETSVHPPDQLTVVGYGGAGIAALSLTIHQRRLGIGVKEAVCVAAGAADDPIGGRPLPDPPPAPAAKTTLIFVPGTDPASITWTAETTEAWRTAGWPVTLESR